MSDSGRTSLLASCVHESRALLVDELHARPFPTIAVPTAVVHVAALAEGWPVAEQEAHVADLHRAFGRTPPAAGRGAHQLASFGELEARFERHQEFCSYTFFAPATGPRFAGGVLARLPPGWLEKIRGRVIVLLRLRVETAPEEDPQQFAELLGGAPVGGRAVDGTASVWTSFRLDAEGFDRVLVRNHALTPERCGRLVQRLIEIENYRAMALLALPAARAATPEVRQLETRLAASVEALAGQVGLDAERARLDELTQLSVGVERLRTATAHRFSAARAYQQILLDRLRELREGERPGYQTIGEFLDRRVTPAMRTCESLRGRLEELARHVAGATALLRTRVDVALEAQNQRILSSLDRRVETQLRIQGAVEGLSIVAIAYYAYALVERGLGAAEKAGVIERSERLAAWAFPLVLIVVWMVLRRIKRRIRLAEASAA